jgi:hypothetical protein
MAYQEQWTPLPTGAQSPKPTNSSYEQIEAETSYLFTLMNGGSFSQHFQDGTPDMEGVTRIWLSTRPTPENPEGRWIDGAGEATELLITECLRSTAWISSRLIRFDTLKAGDEEQFEAHTASYAVPNEQEKESDAMIMGLVPPFGTAPHRQLGLT